MLMVFFIISFKVENKMQDKKIARFPIPNINELPIDIKNHITISNLLVSAGIKKTYCIEANLTFPAIAHSSKD